MKYSVVLQGIRPLMFDRYPGDNTTQLPLQEKMYLNAEGCLMMPATNIYSLLCAENTKSVCKTYYGKKGREVALGVSGYTNIDPFDIPICDDNGVIKFEGWNEQIKVHRSVARLAKGIPNNKERPVLSLPWRIEFDIEYFENKQCTLETLRDALKKGGMLGLGTFRPFFGRYELAKFE